MGPSTRPRRAHCRHTAHAGTAQVLGQLQHNHIPHNRHPLQGTPPRTSGSPLRVGVCPLPVCARAQQPRVELVPAPPRGAGEPLAGVVRALLGLHQQRPGPLSKHGLHQDDHRALRADATAGGVCRGLLREEMALSKRRRCRQRRRRRGLGLPARAQRRPLHRRRVRCTRKGQDRNHPDERLLLPLLNPL